MNQKLLRLSTVAAGAAGIFGASNAHGQSSDALLDKFLKMHVR